MSLQTARAIIGDTANVAGITNFAIHYGPPTVNYLFSRQASEKLIGEAEKILNATAVFFRDECAADIFSTEDMSAHLRSIADWRFRIELEKAVLKGDRSRLLQQLGVEAGLQLMSGDQKTRLTLTVNHLEKHHIEILSASQKKRSKNKRGFEDQAELSNLTDDGYFQCMKSWVQSKISFTKASSTGDVETGAPDLFVSHSKSPSIDIELPDVMTLEATNELPISLEESSKGLCRMGIVIWYQGARYTLGDPKLRTLDDARILMSPVGLSAIAHTAFEVVSRGAIPLGLHKITRSSLMMTPSPPLIVDEGCD